ncbi:MAG TPA: hypothetical protein VFX30_08265 [bacterium]|nr:hypothetical protein [bacterium]
MTPTTLPYLFSPANLATSGAFLGRFQSFPSEGLVQHPDVDGSPGALAAAATVLGSALRLSEEGGKCPAGWTFIRCEPRPVKNAHALFRFEDGITPKIFGGEAAFENRLGQFVSVLWKIEDEIELRTGWAWEEVTAMHLAAFPASGRGPSRTALEVSFEGGRMVSLRRFLDLSVGGIDALLRRLADLVLASGLIVDASPDDFTYLFEKGEFSPWLPVRMDQHYGRFAKNPHVGLFGQALVAEDAASGLEKTGVEKVGLHVGSLVPDEPARLPPALLPLWDLAQSLAMARMPGSTGLSS